MTDFELGMKAGEWDAWTGEGAPFFHAAPRNDYERGYMRGWLLIRFMFPSSR